MYNKQKLAVIGTVGVPANYGGFETLAHHLVLNLNKRLDITVYCSKEAYAEGERKMHWNGATLKYLPFKANGIQSVIYDAVSIIHALIFCDVLLVLGVSGCLLLPFVKLFSKKKIIVNIDGLEWRRPKWNRVAKKFLLFSENIACRFADEIITDNRMLKEYVKIRYSRESQLIEYGGDHNAAVAIKEQDEKDYPFLSKSYAFKVARIEPENNIHVILEAFSKVKEETLVLVGNWNNSEYGKSVRKAYEGFANIHMLDPIYESQLLNLLRSNAKYYVHGHSAGGTNPSLVEAMYLKLPVIAIDVIYNRVTTNNQALYFNTVEELQETLKSIHRQPLTTVAENLKAYTDKKYTWKSIAYAYGNLVDGAFRMPALDDVFVPIAVFGKVKPAKKRIIRKKREVSVA